VEGLGGLGALKVKKGSIILGGGTEVMSGGGEENRVLSTCGGAEISTSNRIIPANCKKKM